MSHEYARRQLAIKKSKETTLGCGYNYCGCCNSHDSGWYLEKCPFKILDECWVYRS